MSALSGVTRQDLEYRFAAAFEARTGKLPARTTIVECDDMLMIRANGTLTKKQDLLSSRDPTLMSELSRSMLDELAHSELWDVAEELAGYPVVAVLADQSVHPDVAVICFVLDKPDQPDT